MDGKRVREGLKAWPMESAQMSIHEVSKVMHLYSYRPIQRKSTTRLRIVVADGRPTKVRAKALFTFKMCQKSP